MSGHTPYDSLVQHLRHYGPWPLAAGFRESACRGSGPAAANSHRAPSLRTRRLLCGTGAAALGVGVLLPMGAASGQPRLPRLPENNPRATALQYTADATAPGLLRPARGSGEFCRNCRFFKREVEQTSRWAGCEIFPEFRVSAIGWCNNWSAKPE